MVDQYEEISLVEAVDRLSGQDLIDVIDEKFAALPDARLLDTSYDGSFTVFNSQFDADDPGRTTLYWSVDATTRSLRRAMWHEFPRDTLDVVHGIADAEFDDDDLADYNTHHFALTRVDGGLEVNAWSLNETDVIRDYLLNSASDDSESGYPSMHMAQLDAIRQLTRLNVGQNDPSVIGAYEKVSFTIDPDEELSDAQKELLKEMFAELDHAMANQPVEEAELV